MSYGSQPYREYALIQGINLLVNMVDRIKDDKITLKEIHSIWVVSGSTIMTLGNQIELIWGTAADGIRCRYMVFCINQLNSYMMSKYPNHIGLIRKLQSNIIGSINMAIFGNAHIWSKTQLESIKAAFMSSRQAKHSPFYDPPPEDEVKKLNNNEIKVLEYNPDNI